MNKILTRTLSATALVIVLFALALAPACNKNKPCKAIVTVLDANNSPVSGVQVSLEPSGSCTTCQTITVITSSTDASGKASFETELPKIMDIYVDGDPTGKVARFEEGKTDEVTVIW
jgi:hypothetical protein